MVDTNTGVSMKLNDAGVCQICGESRTLWDNELDVAICKACGQGELTPQPVMKSFVQYMTVRIMILGGAKRIVPKHIGA